MWDGFLNFYMRASSGDWSAWWYPHNEHRIILSRIIFWLDFKFFGGTGAFSLCATYVFITCMGILLTFIGRDQIKRPSISPHENFTPEDYVILLFLWAWIFSWSQSDNLTWAFQNQFILCGLLPLAGLYFLHRSAISAQNSLGFFILATLLGVLAGGSMANGTFALPVMALCSALIRMRPWRTITLAVLSGVITALYYHKLPISHFPGGEPTLTSEVLRHKIGFLKFVFLYLTNPFIALFTTIYGGLVLILILAAGLIWALIKYLPRARIATLPLALTSFLAYVLITALITAAGRLPLGLPEALSTRYVTIPLYGWAAALLLFWPAIQSFKIMRYLILAALIIIFYGFMVPQQLKALVSPRPLLAERELSALSLELQINDTDQIRIVYSSAPDVLQIAQKAREQHLSIFGLKPIRDAHLLLGQTINLSSFPACLAGHFDRTKPLPNDPAYVHASGWLYNGGRIPKSSLVYFVDGSNIIAGLGLLGESRVDVAAVIGKKAKYAGFEGYLPTKDTGEKLSIFSPDRKCVLIYPAAPKDE